MSAEMIFDIFYGLVLIGIFMGLLGMGDYIMELLCRHIPAFRKWVDSVCNVTYEEDGENT